jgi:hypothetical protein
MMANQSVWTQSGRLQYQVMTHKGNVTALAVTETHLIPWSEGDFISGVVVEVRGAWRVSNSVRFWNSMKEHKDGYCVKKLNNLECVSGSIASCLGKT